MPARDDFPTPVKRLLAQRVGSICSRPDCRAPTAGPALDLAGSTNVGVASHITAAAEGGPRYDPNLSPQERSSAENGVYLCQTCAKLVDDDVDRFSADTLRSWKAAAEAAASRALGQSVGPGGRFAVLKRTLVGHSSYVWDVVVTPDGLRAVTASNDQTAALWDLSSGNRVCVYRGASSEVCSVALSPHGDQVVGGCLDGGILLWDLYNPEPILSWHHGAADAKVAVAVDGSIVSGGADGVLRIWSGTRLAREVEAHDAPVLRVLSPQSNTVVSVSGDGSARVWRLEDARCTATCNGHSGAVHSVAVASNGERLVTGADDCTVKIWDAGNGSCMQTLLGHCETVWRVAIDPTDRLIASGSGDNTVRLWTFHGVAVDELRHPDCVAAVAFSPDGRSLVVGCDDNCVYVYDLPIDDALLSDPSLTSAT